MRISIEIDEIKKLEYIDLDTAHLNHRAVPIFPYYNDHKWNFWIQHNSALIPILMENLVEGYYFAKKPVNPEDVYLKFVNFIVRRCYTTEIAYFEKGICEDLLNLATSLKKVDFFHACWRKDKSSIDRRFVVTEVEYIFKVCRSIYDLFQEIVFRIWQTVSFSDPTCQKKKLKDTFSRMVLTNNQLLTAEEIADKYSLPATLAEFYERQSKFFVWIRKYRDQISHGGKSLDSIYILDDGFAVSTERHPFSGLHIWDITTLKPNGLGSLRALLSYIVLNTLYTLEDFPEIIMESIIFPEDISSNNNVYLRGANAGILKGLYRYCEGEEWVSEELELENSVASNNEEVINNGTSL
jgi:hypothetical protein